MGPKIGFGANKKIYLRQSMLQTGHILGYFYDGTKNDLKKGLCFLPWGQDIYRYAAIDLHGV